MKTMNPIPATKAGKVVEIVAQDGQPVEFGEGLVIID
jgi:acetyl-CoA carboxylase biotin carboxyl carrier protein